MAVTWDAIESVRLEIERLEMAMKAAVARLEEGWGLTLRGNSQMKAGSLETGAVRRASMDLTRALVKLRR